MFTQKKITPHDSEESQSGSAAHATREILSTLRETQAKLPVLFAQTLCVLNGGQSER